MDLGSGNGKRDVYVAGLPEGMDDARLHTIFAPYGEITWCRSLPREGSKTCGLLEFGSAEQAAWVVQNMQGSVPTGLDEPIMVKYKDDPWERSERKGKGWDGKGKGGWGNDSWGNDGWGSSGGWGNDGWDDDSSSRPGLAGAGITVPPIAAIAAAAASAGKGKGGGKEPHVVVPPKGGVKGNLLPYDLQPPRDPLPSDNLYVRGLPGDLSEEQLREIFGAFGNVTQCKLMPGGARQSALVRFSTVAEAMAAFTGLKEAPAPGLCEMVEVAFSEQGQRMNQRYAGDGTPFGIDTIVKGFQMSGLMPGGTGYISNNDNALYIAGLPPDTTDYYLYRLFSPLGSIAPKGVRTLTNEDGTCKGIAFVNYLEHNSAQMAISIYNGAIMPGGSRLKVQIKAPKIQSGPPPMVVPAPVRLPEGFTGPNVAPPVAASVTPTTLPMTVPPPGVDIASPGIGLDLTSPGIGMDMTSPGIGMEIPSPGVGLDAAADAVSAESPGILAMAAAMVAAMPVDAGAPEPAAAPGVGEPAPVAEAA